MNLDLTEVMVDVERAIRQHVAHGHGEILISIKPGTVRVQEGKGTIYNVGGKRA